MLANATGDARQFLLGPLRIYHQMPVLVGQGDEITFRVNDALLHPRRRLLQQAAQKVRLAGTGVALDQQSRGKQFLQIDLRGRAARALSKIDADSHPETSVCCAMTGIALTTTPWASREAQFTGEALATP